MVGQIDKIKAGRRRKIPNIAADARKLGCTREHLWAVLSNRRISSDLLRRYIVLRGDAPSLYESEDPVKMLHNVMRLKLWSAETERLLAMLKAQESQIHTMIDKEVHRMAKAQVTAVTERAGQKDGTAAIASQAANVEEKQPT